MRGVAVEGREKDAIHGGPDEAVRKRVAVELIRNHDRPLRWTARRYSICADDADDAYQRGIEILLSKAPTAEIQQLLPWARTVIKHEALTIRKNRERTLARPGHPTDEDLTEDDWVQLIPAGGDGPDEVTIKRERVARSREALSCLKPAELKALTQLAEGFSYEEIGHMNDWIRTKVNRCLAEGRARFRSAFTESESGERCASFEPMLSACCDSELSPEEMSELENHLAACGHCRATLRAYRAAPRAAAALAPLLPGSRGLWERAQELFIEFQMRFQGVGKSQDSALQNVLASGGTRGAGMAAAAKLAAICAGTAGTAAVCAATGILPAPALLAKHDEKPVARAHRSHAAPEPPRERMVYVDPQPEPVATTDPAPQTEDPAAEEPEPAVAAPVAEDPVVTSSAPAPTPTETEFTPEAAGTPAPATVSAPPQPASNPVPVGNGGGEFAP